MNHTRHLPAFCSLLLLAGPAAVMAQAPLLPPTARRASLGEFAQAAPIAPPPATTVSAPAAGPLTPTDATPAPLDPNAPAPIAPPPTLNGQPGATGTAPVPPAARG